MHNSLRQTPCGLTWYPVPLVRSVSVTQRSGDSVKGDGADNWVSVPSKINVVGGWTSALLERGQRKMARAPTIKPTRWKGIRKKFSVPETERRNSSTKEEMKNREIADWKLRNAATGFKAAAQL